MGQLDPLFDIRALNAEVRDIPPDVDLLMLVQPTRLTKATLYAIEQFVMRGGRALIFVDPYAEAQSITARSAANSAGTISTCSWALGRRHGPG